jgi:RNA polymerase sigma-70 factor (ECF subfamily)
MVYTTIDTTSFRLLLARAQAGDERAFRELVEPYRRALQVHTYRMLGSLDDAEDVTQDTLLRAWRALERFEPRASLQTWLFRIATNACLDEIERRPRRPEPVDPFPEQLRGEADSLIYEPAARYALREGMELALLAAIQLLPGRQRAVLILRDVLGWSGPEVADLLETTLAAVNSALQRARATVDAALPRRAYAPADPGERDLVERYVEVWAAGDFDGLVALLREDAEIRMPPRASVRGAVAVASFLLGEAAHGDLRRMRFTVTRANGRPALIVHGRADDGKLVPHGVKVLDVADGRISGYDAFIAPRYVAMFGP